MKVLVLGATGHIGNATVRELLRRRYKVTATGRSRYPGPNLAGLPITYSPGNLNAPGQIEAWVSGHDIVVDAAAPYPVQLAITRRDDFLADASERTRRLLRAVRHEGARLAYVSSFTTLKRRQGRVDEWPLELMSKLHPYFAVKELIEAEVLEAAARGLEVVIVNPTMCLGPWDLHERSLCLIPRLLGREIPVSMQQMLNVIDVRDVAKGLVRMLESGKYGRPTLLSGHNISAPTLYSWICEIGGVEPPSLSLPPLPGALSAYLGELLLGVGGFEMPIALAAMLVNSHEWQPPCEALMELRIVPRPLYETLLDSIEWYRSIGYC
ncbi:NAD-dependent epimerase/dehydratase family protein [Candidatus Binatus sp.]|uniref:NAD-dependent epimerase/dehydratase family protein n=1 Tax=Candidatus Binatus sp. TaxID=2811406 RepID=UPI003BB06CF4